MKVSAFLVAFLGLLLVASTQALTADEIYALETFSEVFPAMTKASSQADFYLPPIGDLAIPSWLTRPSTSFRSMGGPWPSSWNASSCSSDGWLYFGLHCSGGHIDALYFTDEMRGGGGYTVNLTGLTYVKSLTTRIGDYGSPIATAANNALVSIELEEIIDLAGWVLYDPHTALRNFSALKTLWAPSYTPFFDEPLASYSHLKNISFDTRYLTDAMPGANVVEYRTSSYDNSFHANWTTSPLLEVLEYALYAPDPSYNATTTLPASLKDLTVSFDQPTWFSISQLPISAANASTKLDALSLWGSSDGTWVYISSFPSSVTHLRIGAGINFSINTTIASSPSSPSTSATPSSSSSPSSPSTSSVSTPARFAPFVNLKSVYLENYVDDDLLAFLKSPSSKVEELTLSWWDEPHISELLCNISASSRAHLTSIQLFHVLSYQLPSCYADFNLKVLIMDLEGGGEWEASQPAQPFPSAELYRLRNLTTLLITTPQEAPFRGTLRGDLFSVLWPKLTSLTLSVHQLSGTIPWQGMSSLQVLNLASNAFTSWPPFEYDVSTAMPNLTRVDLSYNQLTTIPDDASLQRLTNLRYFDIAANEFLSGPVPNLFGPRSNLEYFNAAYTRISGSIPTISAPYLWYLNTSTTDMCFSLPAFNRSTSQLNSLLYFDLSLNGFSGSIPSSWSSQPFFFLDLHTNQLGDAIPAQVVSPSSVYPIYMDLRNNLFTLSRLNLSSFPEQSYIDLEENPGTNFCEVDPSVPEGIVCWLSPTSICDCLPLWDMCWDGEESLCSPGKRSAGHEALRLNSTSIASKHLQLHPRRMITRDASVVCSQPEPRAARLAPPSGTNCVPPRPSPNFYCSGTQWVSYSDITSPTPITVPPGTNVVVSGSLTVSALTFGSTDSSLSVGGCIYNLTQVTVNFNQTTLGKLQSSPGKSFSVPLIHTGCTGSSDASDMRLISLKLNNLNKDSGCKKVSVRNAKTSSNTLVASFTLDTSTCGRTWWIVLIAVGAAVILAVAIIVLVVVFNPSAKSAVMPYHGANTM